MKITFIGAAHEVTGSCHFIQACGKNILLDCGMEQGRDTYENQKISVSEADIDYIFLSHAHIDHSGLIPLMYKNGFKGTVYSTTATYDLCKIMLRDSAHIQEFEAEWRNRKAKRSGAEPFEPMYTTADAEGVLEYFKGCDYDNIVTVCDGIKIRFTDVGHLLGSSSIEMWFTEDGVTKKVVFSGDIGNVNQPIIEDPQYIDEADYVIMESTYGNRVHGEKPDYIKSLTKILQETFDRGGNVVIPAFAVGRTQEMLYFIRQIKTEGLIKGHDGFKVYVDSPLAIEAVKVFNRNIYTCFDDEAMELVRKGIDPINFPGLKISITSEDSQAINFDPDPKVILSASGMCEAGRIRHHLKHNLWRAESTILFVGYQADGTVGRAVIDGAKEVKLFGEVIGVNAHIETLAGISGHADKNGLIKWITSIKEKPKKVFVVHGDDIVAEEFSDCLRDEYGYDVMCPYSGGCYDFTQDKILSIGVKIPVEHKVKSAGATKSARLYGELLESAERLRRVISKNKDGANRDLEKLLAEINRLCDKWER